MNRRLLMLTSTVFGISLLIFTGFAQAACTQADMAGSWYFHAWFENTENPQHTSGWSYGLLTVKATGALAASTVTNDDGTKGKILGGVLKVSPSCEITGYLNILEGSASRKYAINHGALSRDHNTVNMVGTNPKGRFFKVDCIRK